MAPFHIEQVMNMFHIKKGQFVYFAQEATEMYTNIDKRICGV